MVILTTPVVNVYIIDFPNSQKEMVVENEDGSYTILLNAKLSNEQQLKSYEHAMKHIKNDDFSKTDVQSIENSAHNVVIPEGSRRIPSMVFERELEMIRKRRRKIQKELEEYERDMKFISSFAGDDSVFERSAERKWLYGGID